MCNKKEEKLDAQVLLCYLLANKESCVTLLKKGTNSHNINKIVTELKENAGKECKNKDSKDILSVTPKVKSVAEED